LYGSPRHLRRERASADRVKHDRDLELVGDGHLAEVLLGVTVVEDASPTQNEDIELSDLGNHLPPRQRARRDRTLDLVPRERIGRVSREDGHVRSNHCPQLAENPFEDRLISQVHPAVRSGDPDA
jgi:hypothetical protein